MSRLPARLTPFFFDSSQPPQTPPTPPIPPVINRGDWTEPTPEGWARKTVAVNFIGTVVHERPDPFATEEQKKKRQAQLDKTADRNERVLNEALFILSQSPTGRDVLEQMTKEGYRVVFDDKRTGERGAGGLCDPSDKMIILRGHDNPAYLALLIGHEAVHAVQNTRHDIFPSTRHKPEAGIKLSFAIEADAYAQQSQIALELAYGDPDGPADQIKFEDPLQQMRQRFPDIMHAAERVLSKADNIRNGASVAAAFEAFYDSFHLRTFYEDAHIEWADTYAPHLKGRFPFVQRHFTKDVDSQWIKDRIQHRGKAYLNQHAPHLTFDDARHSGLTDVTIKKVEKFYADHLPTAPQPKLKNFGVHMKDAVRWVLGLDGVTHVVFKKNDDPTKPPLKAPPRRDRWGFWK
ncbi:MAG: hypothetical protein Q8K65_00625 [Alphaproteobacteria bacterium]|nr:hypothetical protein [Alphaproteobacteria bacterium]